MPGSAHTGSPQIAARTEGRSQRKRARPAYLEAYDEGQVANFASLPLHHCHHQVQLHCAHVILYTSIGQTDFAQTGRALSNIAVMSAQQD